MAVTAAYKQTEIGSIPKDWQDLQLLQVAGDSPICYGIVQVGPFVANGVPVLAIKNLNRDYSTDIHSASFEVERFYARSRVRPQDVLISVKGTTGRVGIVPATFHGNISRDLARIRPGNEFDPIFIFQMLRSEIVQRRLVTAAVGTTRMELSIAILKQIRIPVPPTRAEQRAIAEALSDTDVLVESLEQLIAKKRRIKQGAVQELLTGRKRLPAFAHSDKYKQTEHGFIPKDWEVVNLGTVCSMKSGEGITGVSIDLHSEYPCYGGNGLRGFTARYTHDGRYALIGRVGALCGNVFGVEGRFFASEHAIVVTASARTSIRWLTFILREMRLNAHSEASAQPVLSVSKLSRLKVVFPSTRDEQEAIADALSDIDSELAAFEAKLAKACQIKQGMMQELLTGRIRLV
jgi:type I restriction enzyme S subunit